ncbi:unnamed protein product [Cuscuta campestris]|uniref:BZIP domain-containing protein n=1 Tax=Cuscuta campestris TaxID=132261 RepID=A0A484MRT1_9ASTE|nr:unnamed protein product [Cuscuta campestris]
MAFERTLQQFRYNEDNDNEMVAAKALVGLAHSPVSGSRSSTDSEASEPSLDLFLGSLSHQNRGTCVPHRKKVEEISLLPNALGFRKKSQISSRLLCCDVDYSSIIGACKSKPILTEGEREARRLRRVLANRESARQTIRRRQATYEALAKKAADLALENESLKMVCPTLFLIFPFF